MEKLREGIAGVGLGDSALKPILEDCLSGADTRPCPGAVVQALPPVLGRRVGVTAALGGGLLSAGVPGADGRCIGDEVRLVPAPVP